jgi:hypothetical protein
VSKTEKTTHAFSKSPIGKRAHVVQYDLFTLTNIYFSPSPPRVSHQAAQSQLMQRELAAQQAAEARQNSRKMSASDRYD